VLLSEVASSNSGLAGSAVFGQPDRKVAMEAIRNSVSVRV